MNRSLTKTDSTSLNGRQIAFFAAFILPVYKLLETPSLLSSFTQSDLLLPAILHYFLQSAILITLLYAASLSEQSLFERLHNRLGKGVLFLYIPCVFFSLFIAVLPLLDLEKFTYAAFYDTSPTVFSFAAFFIFSAYFCMQGTKTLGRLGDFSLFLFLIPFISLLFMSLGEADAANLLPVFEKTFGHTMYAFKYTLPHFTDLFLLFPLIASLRYQKGDGKKIAAGYGGGCACVLLFLAVFYGVFSTLAPKTHYAFSKIAQYYPALTVIGRIDLLFVYLLSAILFFYTALPTFYAVDFSKRAFPKLPAFLISGTLNLLAFFFTLFCNKYYNAFYAVFCERLPFVFLAINYVFPLLVLFLAVKLPRKKELRHA